MRPDQAKVRLAGHVIAVWGVLSWPVTVALMFALAVSGSWVGSGHVPSFVEWVVLLPSALGGLSGVIIATIGAIKGYPWTVIEGVFAVLSAVGLFAFAGFGLGMYAIT